MANDTFHGAVAGPNDGLAMLLVGNLATTPTVLPFAAAACRDERHGDVQLLLP